MLQKWMLLFLCKIMFSMFFHVKRWAHINIIYTQTENDVNGNGFLNVLFLFFRVKLGWVKMGIRLWVEV